ncbi:MAG: hypothetical protein RIM99_07700 [Cyclobacteriaceae bacterium]
MKVIWYNSENNNYQSGSWRDYSQLKANSTHPEKILVLERFNDEPLNVISKIVSELNKCRKASNVLRR